MDLSVIIPIYNHEQYIKKCLETILEDFPSNSEIIIIDDVCTDKSIEIIENLHSPYIKILHNEKNKGCAYNLNKGIEAAQGKYIGINYSDDFVEKGFYKKMLDTAIEQDADVVCANIADYDEKNETISYNDITVGNLYYGINKEKIQLKEEPFQVPAGFLLGHWTASSASTKIIKKQYYEKYKFSGSKANDIPAIYPIMAAANKIIYYPDLYLFYRKVENSLSRASDIESYNSVGDSMVKAFRLMEDIENSNDEKEVLFFNNCLNYLFYVLDKIQHRNIRFACIENYIKKLHIYDNNIFRDMKKSKFYNNFLVTNKITEDLYNLLQEGKTIDFIVEMEKRKIEEESLRNLEKKNVENEQLQIAITKQNTQILQLSKANEDMNNQICNIENEKRELVENINNLVNEAKELKVNIDNLKNEKKKLKQNILEVNKENDSLKKNSIVIERNLKSVIDAKDNIIRSYENSLSWRVTRPIRKIRGFIKKI